MALVVKDRVKQTTTTTGTGNIVLNGTVDGFQTFAAVLSNGDTTYYSIFVPSTNAFEVGLGTWTESTATLARTTVLESSNSGNAINITAQAEVFITYPAEKSVYLDASGDVTLGNDLTVTGDFTVNGTTTTINSTNKVLTDSLIELANGTTGTPSNDSGIIIERGDSDNAFIGYDESADKFTVGTGSFTGASTGNLTITTGTLVANVEGNVTGDLTGTASSATNADTVDSLHASSFLRSDANDTATGELTFNAKLDIANGVYLGWGGGSNRPSITGNKTSNLMQFYTGGAERLHIDNSGIDVTGNIVVSGTVDGRDVATDGTKLDGIESGATADQTAAEIRALVESATDSNVFTDADHTKLNGIESNATADQSASEILTAIKTVDGSGSGLDADLLDGYQSNTGTTDTSSGNTIVLRNSTGDLSSRYGYFSYLNMNHGQGDRNSDTIFYSSTDAFLRKNTATGFKKSLGLNSTDSPSFAGLNINGNLNAVDNIYLATAMYHEGDTNTYFEFNTDAMNFICGGGSSLYVVSTYISVYEPMYNYAIYYEDYDSLSGTSVTVNCDTAQAFSITLTGNTTFSFNSVSNAWSTGFIMEITGNGSTVTWPTSVNWAGGTAPDAPASGETDILVFWTRDGGTNWYGVLSIDAAA